MGEIRNLSLLKESIRNSKDAHAGEKVSTILVNDKDHMSVLQPITEQPFSCKICLKIFKHNQSLKTHEKNHTDNKQYSCDHCLKTFSQKCNLKIHKNLYIDKESYSCDQCLKTFYKKGNLKTHRGNLVRLVKGTFS